MQEKKLTNGLSQKILNPAVKLDGEQILLTYKFTGIIFEEKHNLHLQLAENW